MMILEEVIKVIPMDGALAGSEADGCWALKLHRMKFVRRRVVLCSRKKRFYLNGDLFGSSFPLSSWRCNQG
jgi:hypothetical protein